ncbi:MAG: TIGR02186 family protein [Alphaproteobacteria bacterium]
MKKFAAIFLLFISFSAGPAWAQEAQVLTVDLAQNHVDINTGFHGTYLQIFGVIEQPGDIAILVEGPHRSMSVRSKEKILGAWINRSFETFREVPSFYGYATSKPLQEMASSEVLDEYQVGTEHLNVRIQKEEIDPEKLKLFRKALIRNNQKRGLYATHAENIVFLSPGFFRTQIYMPANVPVGEYAVKSLYFHDGEVQEVKTNTLKVAQVGLSAKVFKFAHRKRFLYALVCILIAVFAGWFSNRVSAKR